MFARNVILLFCITSAAANIGDITENNNPRQSTLVSEGGIACQSVQSIPLCRNLGYNNTSFPNIRGHLTPEEANEELAHFDGLIGSGCSNAIVHLLCSIYSPPCLQDFPKLKYPPCKHLCEHVRDGCAATMHQHSSFNWPPGPHLNCSNYVSVQNNHLSFCPPDLSILKIPRTSINRKLFVYSSEYQYVYRTSSVLAMCDTR